MTAHSHMMDAKGHLYYSQAQDGTAKSPRASISCIEDQSCSACTISSQCFLPHPLLPLSKHYPAAPSHTKGLVKQEM